MSDTYRYAVKFRPNNFNLAQKAKEFFLSRTHFVEYTEDTKSYINQDYQTVETGIPESIVIIATFDNSEDMHSAKKEYLERSSI